MGRRRRRLTLGGPNGELTEQEVEECEDGNDSSAWKEFENCKHGSQAKANPSERTVKTVQTEETW